MRLGVSRNDPCPCGSGKKYKKCCLDRDDAYSRQLTSVSVDIFRPGALCIVDDSHVPAIVCDDENEKTLFILARASGQLPALEAAETADEDLLSTPGTTSNGLGPECLRHLHKIGYRIMPAVTADDVDLLDDLLEEDDFEEDSLLEALLFTAEQQIREQSPPEVRQTLVRLRRIGLDRAHIMGMIAHVMLHETQRAEAEGGEPNIPRYVSQLQQLPALNCEHSEETS
jgi:SEC-C motif-containing protein